jgi:uncharacterized repeat protein (TIGR03803 family)
MVGGANRGGVAFELNRKKGGWRERVIYSFCAQQNCADGATPYSPVTVGPSGVLYGTTAQGGRGNGGGVLYQLSPTETRPWSQSVLYSFCSLSNCTDGAGPEGAPTLDSAGNLFGTTRSGGTRCDSDYPCGIAFVFRHARGERTLHPFCSYTICKDGTNPTAGPIQDSAGNLFGTTFYGGAYGNDAAGGVVYEISGAKFQVLYNFCTDRLQCTDGNEPGPLIIDRSGNLYGTTAQGGANNSGVVFEVTP